ncbi:MAG: UDP-glucose/GDP-mannose dehydrogenase family protein [Calditrichia bacterium]|nr:UDP-glucose/GDP-mannose dehydrogenase family protein [Calditrichota bacterium]MCB0269242.1 UDP-glucose/GDP-mannose dehydrogenase family protein [Calditrichota bacterium]MCB0286830.1 UDP-glucose/GDP-mannose dehydrogenase family protein [Calditrichota bacterium]MCB9068587.1 UDP-glucose/GDP-mannose dehydrogenase family protein [Calditrichia bacterium]
MKLTIIGTGYVGLVAGACFAESGNNVICMDKDENKIGKLKSGVIPIYEPGLDLLVKRNQSNGRLTFTTDMQAAVQKSDVIFIAVGTPPGEDGSADLSYVLAVAKSIGEHMNAHKIVVNKSTVPVGTADKVADAVRKHTDLPFNVVSNPEFLKEGAAIDDFMYPDRVIIGTSSNEVAEVMKELYSPFVRTGNPIIIMDERSAEVTKYAANSILATKISFMNEIANLCDCIGADVEMVRKGIGSDKRIGYSFIFPGVGYGGSCFPKDVKAIIRTAKDYNFDMKLLQAVEDVNQAQKSVLIPKIKDHFGGDINGKKFAIWGLSFKPKTDDMREAPSIEIMKALHSAGATIAAHDPVAMEEAKHMGVTEYATLCDDNFDTLHDADGLVLVTEWLNYREPDFKQMKSMMRTPVIFDGRNVYNPQKMREIGFAYYGIGRR